MSTTPNYQQTLEGEMKETKQKVQENPRNLDNKRVVKAKLKQQGQGKESPPPPQQKKKKRGSKTRTAALKPKPEQTPKEETQARNNRRIGCDKRPRGQNSAAEIPRELNPQEQQEGTKDSDQTTCPAKAGVGQTFTAE